MGAGESSQFPFKVGQEKTGYRHPYWKMFDGTKSSSGEAVTIFTFNKTATLEGVSYLPVAQNALQRLRTLRHPNVLRFIDGVELPTSLHIVTEPVSPFSLAELAVEEDGDTSESSETKKQHHEASLTLGLYQIITAVTWLNTECHVIHGNVQQNSIFMTKGGDWRLGGLDVVSPHTPLSTVFLTFQTKPYVLPTKLKPPELADQKFSAIEQGPVTAIDAWCLGCLIYECFNTTLNSAEQLAQLGAIPKSIQAEYKRLLHTNPAQRLLPSALLSTKLFDNDLVKKVTFVDSLALKTTAEKETFFQQFSVDELPLRCAKYKILPQLINALEYGSGLSCFAVVLNSVLQIGASLAPDEYTAIVIPAIVKLFSSQERQVRVNLLQHLGEYSKFLSKELVNDKIFHFVIAGFNDSLPSLRELTVRSMAIFAPQLSEATLDSQVLKCLMTCQTDQVPTVRQNTTYVLAKIAGFLSESSREKFLVPSFARALRDPYPPSRVASITSLGATLEYHSPVTCAQKILPMLSAVCLDPELPVRQAALQCCQRVLAKLEAYSNHLSTLQAQQGQAGAGDKGAAASAASSGWLSYVSDVSSKVVSQATNTLIAGGGKRGDMSVSPSLPSSGSPAVSPLPTGQAQRTAAAASSATLAKGDTNSSSQKNSSSSNSSNSSSSTSSGSSNSGRSASSAESNNTKSASANFESRVQTAQVEIHGAPSGWGDEDFFDNLGGGDDLPIVELPLSTKKKATATAPAPVADAGDPWADAVAATTKPEPSKPVSSTATATVKPVAARPKAVAAPRAVTINVSPPQTKPKGNNVDNWEDFLNS